jgi:hypothetical protein
VILGTTTLTHTPAYDVVGWSPELVVLDIKMWEDVSEKKVGELVVHEELVMVVAVAVMESSSEE